MAEPLTVEPSSPPIPVNDDVIPMPIILPELAVPLDPFDTVALDNIVEVLFSHKPGDGTTIEVGAEELVELLSLFTELFVTSVVELEPIIPFLLPLSVSVS